MLNTEFENRRRNRCDWSDTIRVPKGQLNLCFVICSELHIVEIIILRLSKRYPNDIGSTLYELQLNNLMRILSSVIQCQL